MTRLLARVLGKSEEAVAAAINKFEELAGSPSEDLRLLSENKIASRKKITQLGLDSDDTTGEELYRALLLKYQTDSQSIDKAVGIEDGADFEKKLSRAINLVEQAIGRQEVWAVKATSARQLLRACPPKKMMKQFGYRSLESMLKREAVGTLILAAPSIESSAWQKDFNKAVAKLGSTDYVMQPVSLIKLPQPIFGKMSRSQSVAVSKLAGATAIWPSKANQKAGTLSLTIMLADGLEQLGLNVSLQSFSVLHPALGWWANTSHLLSVHEDEVVSLNLKDVALNHLLSLDYQNRLQSHAQQNFWEELKERYHHYSQNIGDIIPEIESELSGKAPKISEVPIPMQLAAETVEA